MSVHKIWFGSVKIEIFFANFVCQNFLENMKPNNINSSVMWISIIAGVLIFLGTVLLVLSTLPMSNTLDGNKLTVHFVIGKKVINMEDAEYLPVPDDISSHIIRVNGTSVGNKHSGRYMNTKTKNKYTFYLTGKGEKVCFKIGDTTYVVDDITPPAL